MVGELIADRYELEELVGSGGMSSVYRAHDTLLERSVALKILHEQYTRDDDYVERFRREARSVARLHHPNIAEIRELPYEGGRGFFYTVAVRVFRRLPWLGNKWFSLVHLVCRPASAQAPGRN